MCLTVFVCAACWNVTEMSHLCAVSLAFSNFFWGYNLPLRSYVIVELCCSVRWFAVVFGLFMAALCNRGTIILLCCGLFMVALCNRETIYIFIMVALCNRADHYILWSPYVIGRPYIFSSCFFLLSSSSFFFFFSSPNLSGPKLDVYHTLAHGVALVRI